MAGLCSSYYKVDGAESHSDNITHATPPLLSSKPSFASQVRMDMTTHIFRPALIYLYQQSQTPFNKINVRILETHAQYLCFVG